MLLTQHALFIWGVLMLRGDSVDGNMVQPFLTPGAWLPGGKRRKLAGQGKRHSIVQHPCVLAILWDKTSRDLTCR